MTITVNSKGQTIGEYFTVYEPDIAPGSLWSRSCDVKIDYEEIQSSRIALNFYEVGEPERKLYRAGAGKLLRNRLRSAWTPSFEKVKTVYRDAFRPFVEKRGSQRLSGVFLEEQRVGHKTAALIVRDPFLTDTDNGERYFPDFSTPWSVSRITNDPDLLLVQFGRRINDFGTRDFEHVKIATRYFNDGESEGSALRAMKQQRTPSIATATTQSSAPSDRASTADPTLNH